jgi:hypothetical protein
MADRTSPSGPHPGATPEAIAGAAELRQRIRDALAADLGATQGDSVHVRVADGAVTITGEVPSTLIRDRVADLVGSVPGVTKVEDLLLVVDDHTAIRQTRVVDDSSAIGSSRGTSPQEFLVDPRTHRQPPSRATIPLDGSPLLPDDEAIDPPASRL